MRRTRSVAFQLAREGFLAVFQRGKKVEMKGMSEQTVRGPIRLRLLPISNPGKGGLI